MYKEVTIKGDPQVVKVENGQALAQVELEPEPNDAFQEWFRNPGDYSYNPRFSPAMCHISGNKLQFSTSENAMAGNFQLLKEWIAKANEHAKEVERREEARAEQHKKSMEEKERKRRELEEGLK
jgi:hypothetical protein